jgi:hypothetical protein
MNSSIFQTQAQDLLRQNKFERVFAHCSQYLGSAQALNTALLLEAQYNDLKNEVLQGLSGDQDATARKNRLRKHLLDFIQSIESTDLKAQPHTDFDAILQSAILVVCPSPAQQSQARALFGRLPFQNIDIQILSHYTEAGHYKLLVFDNTDLPFCNSITMLANMSEKALIEQRVALMGEFLAQSKRPLVHWGDILYWLQDKKIREYVQAANSKFTLYARMREVLDFMNDYQA